MTWHELDSSKSSIMNLFIFLLGISFLVLLLLFLVWTFKVRLVSKVARPQNYAFFHPYCSGGGGGERVLWKIIQYLQQQNNVIFIFTIDPADTDEAQLREDAQRRFDVHIPHPIHLISLQDHKHLLDPQPFLSLVMESWGTMKLARKGLEKFAKDYPDKTLDVYCDTTGCAFTFFWIRWLCPWAWILTYVHYPTISTDMMAFEWQKEDRAAWKSLVKLIYYWWFAIAYGLVGSLADVVMVNSTWTYNHIRSLWWRQSKTIDIVYPPCRIPTAPTLEEPRAPTRAPTIVSIGQFRPEKNHRLQIESLANLLEKHPQHRSNGIKLLLIGSCRNDADRQRVNDLKDMVQRNKMQDVVEFSINPPYQELQRQMQEASIGIHTMRQEHFGIGIVEMMAAGLLVVAHNSGGPRSDIVQPTSTGFLATTADEYAECLHQALTLPQVQADQMRQAAQSSATRFSDQVFDDSLRTILPKLQQ